ncbi:MAG: hypothetical protein EMLJLAPB_00425 [Candidatus Argoarchaeum ethanivorans]|uniref:Uncharacterized protein n=1 Tax=Candidatus Argoarchaeum ethanivorans TaxID=2608793 RepID=A0A811TB88_9EURY|nr:MAG: hypothetical protein EMLJLAPB_00425 [Candidatus Argoarchaeum ethanivorans]
MIKKFRIAEDVDVVMMECIVDEMRDLLQKLVSGEVLNENNYVLSDLMDFCISLIDGQRGEIGVKSGSWCVAPSAKGMPSDARVYLVFFPTYIAIAILTRVLLDYPEIPEELPEYGDVLRRGFKFATYRRLRGHGIGAETEMIEVLEILSSGGVMKYLSLNPDFCPELLQILKKIKEELSDALGRGVTSGSWGEDYVRAFEFVKDC